MKKNTIKITLDMIMLVILILLYSNCVLSFHEIAGLGIFVLFIIHCLINRKWFASIPTKLFDKSLPAKPKLGYFINLLLIISFTLIIISGVKISEVLFPASAFNNSWRMVHDFCTHLTIILVGTHIGLHWSFIKGMFKKLKKIPSVVTKPTS